MSDPVYKRRTELMEAELGDELVGLDPAAGECFGFNSVATSVWRGRTPQEQAAPTCWDGCGSGVPGGGQVGSVASSVTGQASGLEEAQVTWPGRAR